MPIAVITRARTSRLRHLVPFLRASMRVGQDARRSEGFLAGAMRTSRGPEFWTLTLWADGRAMHAWATGAVHAQVMPRMAEWASDASTAAWPVDTAELPDWAEAQHRLLAAPRYAELEAPSEDHRARAQRPMPHRGLVRRLRATGAAETRTGASRAG